MQSSLWDRIDPAARFRVAPTGYDNGASDPSRQSVAQQFSILSPEHQNFGFLLVLVGVASGLYYVFEHGGAGAGAKAHVGPAKAEAGLDIGGK